MKLDNRKDLISVPKNVANFNLVDKWPFGSTRSLKFLKSYMNVLVGIQESKKYIKEWCDCIRKLKT